MIVDNAPSGHTLRLLDLTGSYHRQIMKDPTILRGRVTTPLTRLQDSAHSRVLIVTLAELTPVSEAAVLQDDLRRAGIEPFGWVINASLTASGTRDPLLLARAALEGALSCSVSAISSRLGRGSSRGRSRASPARSAWLP